MLDVTHVGTVSISTVFFALSILHLTRLLSVLRVRIRIRATEARVDPGCRPLPHSSYLHALSLSFFLEPKVGSAGQAEPATSGRNRG
jgi:hypothetical protein